MTPCPVCENKQFLSSLDYTPESLREIARAETVNEDTCPDDLYEARLAICESCPDLIGGMTCKNCGCFVQLRAHNKSGHCAFGKW